MAKLEYSYHIHQALLLNVEVMRWLRENPQATRFGTYIGHQEYDHLGFSFFFLSLANVLLLLPILLLI